MFPSPRAGTLPCWKYIVLITDGMCKKDGYATCVVHIVMTSFQMFGIGNDSHVAILNKV